MQYSMIFYNKEIFIRLGKIIVKHNKIFVFIGFYNNYTYHK